ncbi:hypothetical protein HK096_000574, partial [Nowakowskiella sp. JEL0078]
MYRWSSLTYRDLLRLSFNLSPEYLDRKFRGGGPFLSMRSTNNLKSSPMIFTSTSDAIKLLLRIFMKQMLGYLTALAVTLAVAGIVVKNVATGLVVNAQFIMSSDMDKLPLLL